MKGSFELKVIADLSNRNKHGGPPRNGGPSGLSPDLAHFRRGLTAIHQGQTVTATIDFFGQAPQVEFGDGAGVVTSADVVDTSGKVIGDAMTLLEAGTLQWNQVLAQYGLTSEHAPG